MMDEKEWIGRNIKQRTCVLYSRLAEDQLYCKCLRLPDNHPKDCKNDEASKPWTMVRNTTTTDCTTYGDLVFDDRSTKFVRMDVKTDMSTVKHLLFNVWDLPKPQWLLSVIGKVSEADEKERRAVKDHIETLLSTQFAGCQSNMMDIHKTNTPPFQVWKGLERSFFPEFPAGNSGKNDLSKPFQSWKGGIWITTDGVQGGVSALVGEGIEKSDAKNITALGIYSWGFSTPNANPFVQADTGKQRWKINGMHKQLHDAPSKLFSHHIFTDDGSFHPENTYKSYQDFKARMEKHIAESDTYNPIPYIIILCGGLLENIVGVRRAIESNTPIIVMQGSGGYADVLVRLLEVSRPKSKPLNTDSLSWTGTVNDDELRQNVEDEVAKKEGSPNKSAESILLQCLQKRELLTVLDPDQNHNLLDCIIKSLFESQSDMTRILDFYMPAKIYSDRGTASLRLPAQLSSVRNQKDKEERNRYSILVTFFTQALKLDRADSIEFIIDYDGLPLEKLATQNRILKKLDMDVIVKRENDRVRPFFKHLFDWALTNNKQKCAVLFWKKGDTLILSALQASSKLSQMSKLPDSQRKVLEEHSRLFEGRAIGLIEECFKDNKEHTMLLMTRHSTARIDSYADSYLQFALDFNNRRIFSSEAFCEYMRRVWIGDINPFLQGSGRVAKDRSTCTCDGFWRFLAAPRTRFIMSVIMYVTYLLLFAYTLVVELSPVFSLWEGAVGLCWLGMVFEEFRQILFAEMQTDQVSQNRKLCTPSLTDKVKAHFKENFWNYNDVLCLTTFFIGAVFLIPVHIDPTQLVLYDVARFFLSVDIVFATLRTVQFLAASKFFGSILEMIWRNMQDMLLFLVIIMISVVAEGFGILGLLKPNSQLNVELVLSVFRYPFWYIFGELFLDEVEASGIRDECTSNPLLYLNDTLDRCPSNLARIAVPGVMGVYLVLMNVLLLNIIIARFSYTFQLVHDQAVWVAAVHGAKLTLEYFKRPPVPSPINLIYHPFHCIYRCIKRCCKVENVSGLADLNDSQLDVELAKWERSVAEYYLASVKNSNGKANSPSLRRHGNREDTTHELATIKEQLSKLLEVVEDLRYRQRKLEDTSQTPTSAVHQLLPITRNRQINAILQDNTQT